MKKITRQESIKISKDIIHKIEQDRIYDQQKENSKINYKETKYGFEYGSAEIERMCSDKKKGWVVLRLKTPKKQFQLYITKTRKVRIFDESDKDGMKELTDG